MSFGAVAAIGGAVIASDAAGNAADKQAGAANAATAAQRAAADRASRLQEPYQQSGSLANNQLQYLLGLGGGEQGKRADSIYADMLAKADTDHVTKYGIGMDQSNQSRAVDAWKNEIRRQAEAQSAQEMQAAGGQIPSNDPAYGSLMRKFSEQDFEADPGYKFRMDEGLKGVERSAASRGGLFSGAAAKSLERFGQGLASQEYGNAYNRFTNDQTNQYNRLAGLVNTGQGAANQIGNAQLNFGNQQANNLIGAGNAQAAGGIAQANAITGGINDAFNYYNQTNALNKALQSGSAYGNLKNQYFTGTGGMGD